MPMQYCTVRSATCVQVNSVHVSPMDANVMATSSNDWTVRLNDVRMLGTAPADSKGAGPIMSYACLLACMLDRLVLEIAWHHHHPCIPTMVLLLWHCITIKLASLLWYYALAFHPVPVQGMLMHAACHTVCLDMANSLLCCAAFL